MFPRRLQLLLGVLILLALAAGLWWWQATRQERIISRVTSDYPADGVLRSAGGEEQGNARYEHHDRVFKVVYSMTTEPPAQGEAYHGWLHDPAAHEYRYAGIFYPLQDNQHMLSYTTEEDISRFDQLLVSRESHDAPAAPTDIVSGGALEIESPPSSSPEPSPEPSSELSPTATP